MTELPSVPEWYVLLNQYSAARICDHTRTGPRRKTFSNRSIHVWVQCLECGARVRDLKHGEIAGRVEDLPEFDDSLLEEQSTRTRNAAWREYTAAVETWRRAYYGAYLRSPAWAERRAAVIERAQELCEGCRKRPATIVHHLRYDHVGNEFLFELVAVCGDCHRRLHAADHDRDNWLTDG